MTAAELSMSLCSSMDNNKSPLMEPIFLRIFSSSWLPSFFFVHHDTEMFPPTGWLVVYCIICGCGYSSCVVVCHGDNNWSPEEYGYCGDMCGSEPGAR